LKTSRFFVAGSECQILDAGYRMADTGCQIPDTGCRMLKTRFLKKFVRIMVLMVLTNRTCKKTDNL
jgi:hypothetical protein